MSEEEDGAAKKFNGFEPDWYESYANKIGFFIFLSFIFSTSIDVLYAFFIFLLRFYDRQFKLTLKKDPDDIYSDSVNTRIRSQT